jgi:hypothetical protein
MASYKVKDYLNARLPNLSADMPGVDLDMLATGAMAVYWSFFFPSNTHPIPPAIEDQMLTERQKVICALRAAVSIVPALVINLGGRALAEAHGGPAGAKFHDPAKIYKQLGDMMTSELELLESAEGVMLKPGEGIPPAYLMSVPYPVDCAVYASAVVSRNIIDVSFQG